MSGWIKLHRTLTEWEWYDDHNATRLLVHLLVTVNYEDKKWKGILVKAGSRITSFQKLADETGLTVKQIRCAMLKLENSGEVARGRAREGQAVSLVKWEKMQNNEPEQGKQKGRERADEGQAEGKQGATTKELKNLRTQEPKKEEKKKVNTTLLCSFSSKTELDNDIDRATFSFWELFKSNLLEAGITKTTLLDKATLEKWRVPVKLMMEKDSRTVAEFTEVFKFLKTNAFWKKNIQSTEKLREKFERLLVEARQKPESKKDKPLIEPHHAERIARNLRGQ